MWIDIDGVGAGPYDNLRAQGRRVFPFQGGLPAYDQDRYRNRRAEEYWALRSEFELGMIDIDPTDDVLANQLMSIKFSYTSRGQIRIESKEDMEKRGLKSPDRADAVMMSRRRAPHIPTPLTDGSLAVEDLTSDLLERAM